MNAALGARGVVDFAALTAVLPAAFFATGALEGFFAVAGFAAGLLLAAALFTLFAAVFLAAGLVAADFLAVAIFKPPHYRIEKLRHVTHR
jgi:hypothetical protein